MAREPIFMGLSGAMINPPPPRVNPLVTESAVLAVAAGPGPAPNPWKLSGSALYYDEGGITLPLGVTGGDKGPGSINLSEDFFKDGVALKATPTGAAGGDLAGSTYPDPVIKTSVNLRGSPTTDVITGTPGANRIATTTWVNTLVGKYLPLTGGKITSAGTIFAATGTLGVESTLSSDTQVIAPLFEATAVADAKMRLITTGNVANTRQWQMRHTSLNVLRFQRTTDADVETGNPIEFLANGLVKVTSVVPFTPVLQDDGVLATTHWVNQVGGSYLKTTGGTISGDLTVNGHTNLSTNPGSRVTIPPVAAADNTAGDTPATPKWIRDLLLNRTGTVAIYKYGGPGPALPATVTSVPAGHYITQLINETNLTYRIFMSKTDALGNQRYLMMLLAGDQLVATDDRSTPPVTAYARFSIIASPLDGPDELTHTWNYISVDTHLVDYEGQWPPEQTPQIPNPSIIVTGFLNTATGEGPVTGLDPGRNLSLALDAQGQPTSGTSGVVSFDLDQFIELQGALFDWDKRIGGTAIAPVDIGPYNATTEGGRLRIRGNMVGGTKDVDFRITNDEFQINTYPKGGATATNVAYIDLVNGDWGMRHGLRVTLGGANGQDTLRVFDPTNTKYFALAPEIALNTMRIAYNIPGPLYGTLQFPGTSAFTGPVTFSNTVGFLGIDVTNNVTVGGKIGIGTVTPQTMLELSADNSTATTSTMRFTDRDTATVAGQQMGRIEFYSMDTTPGAGVKAYMVGAASSITPGAYIAFGLTDDNVVGATEKMRIHGSGAIGIGTTAVDSQYGIYIVRALSGAAASYGVRSDLTLAATVTSSSFAFMSEVKTDPNCPVDSIYHYYANQPLAFGTGSVVDKQYGFYAGSGMTGAAANYSFYGNLSNVAGRWNLYMNGTAPNYLAGGLGLGTTAPAGLLELAANNSVVGATNTLRFTDTDTATAIGQQLGKIEFFTSDIDAPGASVRGDLGMWALSTTPQSYFAINMALMVGYPTPIASATVEQVMRISSYGNVTIGAGPGGSTTSVYVIRPLGFSATAVYGIRNEGVIQPEVNDPASTAVYYRSVSSTTAATQTVNSVWHYFAEEGTFAAPSIVNAQYAFGVSAGLSGALKNYCYYSALAANVDRNWGLYLGTAPSYIGGPLGIGSTAVYSGTGVNLRLSLPMSASTTYGMWSGGGVQVGVTTAYYFATSANTVTTSAVTNLRHYMASSGTFNGTVATQAGFYAASNITAAATANYGFQGDIAAAANRWNIYMAGSAQNYFAGNVGIGATLPATKLEISALTTTTGGNTLRFTDTDTAVAVNQQIGRIEFFSNNALGAGPAVRGDIGMYYEDLNAEPYFMVRLDVDPPAGALTQIIRAQSNGQVVIGAGASTTAKLTINSAFDVVPTTYGVWSAGAIQPLVTTAAYYNSAPSTAAGSHASVLYHYLAGQGTFDATGPVDNQYAFYAGSSVKGATSNFGFYSNMVNGPSNWAFYSNGAGTPSYLDGPLGIGSTGITNVNFRVERDLASATGTAYAAYISGSAQALTTSANYLAVISKTTGVVPTVRLIYLSQSTLTGAVADQYGIHIASTLASATRNYGLYTELPVNANNYNIYSTGAQNYFAGATRFATIPTITATMPANTTNSTQVPTMSWVQSRIGIIPVPETFPPHDLVCYANGSNHGNDGGVIPFYGSTGNGTYFSGSQFYPPPGVRFTMTVSITIQAVGPANNNTATMTISRAHSGATVAQVSCQCHNNGAFTLSTSVSGIGDGAGWWPRLYFDQSSGAYGYVQAGVNSTMAIMYFQ